MIKHLACIMDGNRRWACQNGKHHFQGHEEGLHAIDRVLQFCIKHQIAYLSLYAFSLENFKRNALELAHLFGLVERFAQQAYALCNKHAIRIMFIGDRSQFPHSTIKTIEQLEQKTAHYQSFQVNILFCYGGQQEIIAGVKKIAHEIKEGFFNIESLTIKTFASYLWTHTSPDPEIVIRTGGATRMSNFMPYQTVYAEWFFLDCFWPDITDNHLLHVFEQFKKTQRNFGI